MVPEAVVSELLAADAIDSVDNISYCSTLHNYDDHFFCCVLGVSLLEKGSALLQGDFTVPKGIMCIARVLCNNNCCIGSAA